MNKDLHDIDKFFKAIEEHLEEVPQGVWNEIDHSLDKRQAISFRHKYQQLKRYSIMVLMVGLLGGAYALLHQSVNPLNHESAQSTETNKRKTSRSSASGQASHQVKGESHTTAIHPLPSNQTPASIIPPNEKTMVSLPAASTKAQHIHVQEKYTAQTKIIARSYKNNDIEKERLNGKSQPGEILAFNTIKNNTVISPFSGDKTVEKPIALVPESIKEPVRSRLLNLGNTERLLKAQKAESSLTVISKNSGFNQLQEMLIHPPQLKTTKQSRILLTAFMAPELSFDRLEDDHHMPNRGPGRDQFRRNEQKTGASSKGLLFSYGLNNRWRLSTGFISSISSSTIAPTILYAKPDINGKLRYEFNCSSGNSFIESKVTAQPTVNDSVQLQGTITHMQFVSIPLTLQYVVPLGRFSFLPAAGFSASFITKGNVSTTVKKAGAEEQTLNSLTDLRSVSLNASVQAGLYYKVSSVVSLSVTPGARFGITSVTKNTSVKSYQNFLSLSGGINFSF